MTGDETPVPDLTPAPAPASKRAATKRAAAKKAGKRTSTSPARPSAGSVSVVMRAASPGYAIGDEAHVSPETADRLVRQGHARHA